MTFKVNHAYTSAIPDDPADFAAGKVTPSRWNADLVATMNSGRLAGRVSSGNGAVEELDSSAVAGFLGLGSAAYSSTGDFAPSSHTHSAADITSGTFADARIAQSNVTQHQSALSISWTQVGNTPTTLAGYGITDAAPLSHVGSGGAAHANAVPNGAAGFMTGADKNKLDGIQAGATANSSDSFLLNRANHTGTQTASTISNFAAAARAETEAELIAGSGITITPAGSGANRTLTLSATGGGGGYPSIAYPRRTSTPKIAGDIGGTALSTITLTASRQYFIPLVVPRDVTLPSLRISVTTAASGAANLGIYANTQSGGNDVPGARIAQITATLDTGSTGDKTGNFASSVTLTAGTLYWVSVICSAAAVIRALAVGSCQVALGRQVNSTGAITYLFVAGSGSTLPDPAPGSLSDGTGVCPAIYLIE
jgi:hypothetical protein